jgi:hypothetical protein
MSNLLYLIAVVLVVIWIFGYFITPFGGGGIIHILLIALLLGVIRRA